MNEQPILFDAHASYLSPKNGHWAKLYRTRFRPGKTYALVEYQERSPGSHKHYFAAVHDAWMSLPDHLAKRFATPEQLRKYALIKCGYHLRTEYVVPNHAEAMRLATVLDQLDKLAVVEVRINIVTRYVARSQSRWSMDKLEFEDSKAKVLAYIAGLLHVHPNEIEGCVA